MNQIGDKEVRERQEAVFQEIHQQLKVGSSARLIEVLEPLLAKAGGKLSAVAPAAVASATV
ncbi:MAG: hypothetical protein FJY37_20360 [Betaproteobacteria bacterium]|nr:hypothetical protein [Betaproteobacteria bacterium]